MSSQPVSYISPEEFLERERAAETKHEYVFGEMVAMAGGSPAHAMITGNVYFELRTKLRDRSCELFSPDLRVSVRWGSLITYPDVTVLCGAPQWADEKRDTLTNPALIVEVLSPSTKGFDRGEKARLYRMLPSLREYLLVDQTPFEIEHYQRMDDGAWKIATVRERDAVLRLESLDCDLAVSEIYRGLEVIEQ